MKRVDAGPTSSAAPHWVGPIGAGIGAGVDALFDRRSLQTVQPGVRLTIKF